MSDLRKSILKKGTVISNKMENTVIVKVDKTMIHPKYKKVVSRSTKYYAHTEKDLNCGDEVTIRMTRPISKLKRWIVV